MAEFSCYSRAHPLKQGWNYFLHVLIYRPCRLLSRPIALITVAEPCYGICRLHIPFLCSFAFSFATIVPCFVISKSPPLYAQSGWATFLWRWPHHHLIMLCPGVAAALQFPTHQVCKGACLCTQYEWPVLTVPIMSYRVREKPENDALFLCVSISSARAGISSSPRCRL